MNKMIRVNKYVWSSTVKNPHDLGCDIKIKQMGQYHLHRFLNAGSALMQAINQVGATLQNYDLSLQSVSELEGHSGTCHTADLTAWMITTCFWTLLGRIRLATRTS